MKLLRTALAATAIALTGAAAQADQLEVFGYTGNAMFDTADDNAANVGAYTLGGLLWQVDGGAVRSGVGALVAKNYTDQTSFIAFCLEPYIALSNAAANDNGTTTQGYTRTPITDPANSPYVKLQRLFDLYGAQATVGLSPAQGTNSIALWGGAMQLAIWNLLYDTDMVLESGDVRVLNAATYLGAVSLANQMVQNVYLNNAAAPSKLMTVWFNEGASSQDIIQSAAVVPEPSTYAMVLAGVGIVGYSLRRRQHKAA